MRNRIRRRLREAVRLPAPHTARAGTDYVLVGRRGSTFTGIRPAGDRSIERDHRAVEAGRGRKTRGPDRPPMPENRNFILAIALSIAVLIGWQYFVAGPQIERAATAGDRGTERSRQQAPQPAPTARPGHRRGQAIPPVTDSPVPRAAGVEPAPTLTREAALAQSPRVPIATGAAHRFDQSARRAHRRSSPQRTSTRPSTRPARRSSSCRRPRGPDGYFAEFGWIGPTERPAGARARHGVDSAGRSAELTATTR